MGGATIYPVPRAIDAEAHYYPRKWKRNAVAIYGGFFLLSFIQNDFLGRWKDQEPNRGRQQNIAREIRSWSKSIERKNEWGKWKKNEWGKSFTGKVL